MVSLLPNPVSEAQAVEDLQAAALEPISLTGEDLCISLVNDARLDSTVSHPSGCHQSMVNNGGQNGSQARCTGNGGGGSYPAGPAPMMSLLTQLA